jgi:hypothetical protein
MRHFAQNTVVALAVVVPLILFTVVLQVDTLLASDHPRRQRLLLGVTALWVLLFVALVILRFVDLRS